MDLPTKISLRSSARRALSLKSPEARATDSAAICEILETLPEWPEAKVVGLFVGQASEPDLMGLLGKGGKRFCFPRVCATELEFRECGAAGLLVAGPWDLLEPDPARCGLVEPGEIDLICVPGLAFTEAGMRLGRGGGFYDRFLRRLRPGALKIGVCFKAQLVPEIPHEPHDIAVDRVVTEP